MPDSRKKSATLETCTKLMPDAFLYVARVPVDSIDPSMVCLTIGSALFCCGPTRRLDCARIVILSIEDVKDKHT